MTHRQARHAPLELLELGHVDLGDGVSHRAEHRSRPRRVGGHEHPVATEQHDVRTRRLREPPGTSGTRWDRRRWSGWPTTVPSGSAVTADLRCSTLVTGTATTVQPRGDSNASSCAIAASFVRPPTPTYTVRSILSTSPPSSVAGSMTRPRSSPSCPRGSFRAVDLASTAGRSGSRDHGEVIEHDERILDEDGVGTVVGWLDLDDGPSRRFECGDVRVPLPEGQIVVDRHPFPVGDQPGRQRPAGTSDECLGHGSGR